MENRHRLDLHTPPADLNKNFDDVYAAAKALDEPALKKLLARDDYCIDPFHHMQTPASKLTEQGHFAAAELLLSLGANQHFVAEHAAMNEHFSFAEKVRKEYGAKPGIIASGACAAGNYVYAEWLRERYGLPLWHLIYGAAYRGDLQYVQKVCDLETLSEQEKLLFCQSLALGGHYQLLKEQISTCFPNEEAQGFILPVILISLGMAGRIELIEQWIEENHLSEKITSQFDESAQHHLSLVSPILLGLLMGNYYTEVLAFIKRYHLELTTNLTEIFIAGAAFCGHFSEVKRLMPPRTAGNYLHLQMIVATNAARANNKKMLALGNQNTNMAITIIGQIKMTGDLFFFKDVFYDPAEQTRRKELLELVGDLIIEGSAFENEKHALYILSSIDDHEFVRQLATELMSSRRNKPELHPVLVNDQLVMTPTFLHKNTLNYNFKKIAQRAIKINILRHKYFLILTRRMNFYTARMCVPYWRLFPLLSVTMVCHRS